MNSPSWDLSPSSPRALGYSPKTIETHPTASEANHARYVGAVLTGRGSARGTGARLGASVPFLPLGQAEVKRSSRNPCAANAPLQQPL